MFPAPETPPLMQSVNLHAGPRPERVTYTRYHVKNRVPCDECIWVLHEGSGNGAWPRSARWKRVADGKELLLCHEHCEMWRKEEAKK